MAVNDPEYSPLAVDPLKSPPMNGRSAHHQAFGQIGKDIYLRQTNPAYNKKYLNPLPIEGLPKYDSVLVIGAGPSVTQEVLDRALAIPHDAVLVTLPMARACREILERPGVYVVDAERDHWITPHYYLDMKDKVRLICRRDKYMQNDWVFREYWVYGRDQPTTTGAIALYVALDEMQAKRVDVIGVDLSHGFVQFKHETEPWLKRAHKL